MSDRYNPLQQYSMTHTTTRSLSCCRCDRCFSFYREMLTHGVVYVGRLAWRGRRGGSSWPYFFFYRLQYFLFECCWWNACGSWQSCVYVPWRRFQRNKTGPPELHAHITYTLYHADPWEQSGAFIPTASTHDTPMNELNMSDHESRNLSPARHVIMLSKGDSLENRICCL